MRLATDLGLHIDAAPFVERGVMDLDEARLRSSVFWGTYTHERYAVLIHWIINLKILRQITECGVSMWAGRSPLIIWISPCSCHSRETPARM